ncbi:MAG: regulator of ribonuclease activity A, partial [Urechidicola sp.]
KLTIWQFSAEDKTMDYSLPDLCDAYPDRVRVLAPLLRNFGARNSFAGQIVTIKCHEDNSLVAQQVAQPGAGQVLVVDGGGSLRCGLLGDNLALKAVQNHWQGIVIFGCLRDVDLIASMDLGVQALASHPLKSVKRQVGLLNEPVTFGGVTFVPGEYLYADSNGLLVSTDALSPHG